MDSRTEINIKGCNNFFQKEKIRYQRKGYGIVFACLLTFLYFWGVPEFGRRFWPSILNFLNEYNITYIQFFCFWQMTQHNLIHLSLNLVLYVFYKYEFPCVENYKTNYLEPWPWHNDPLGWRKLVK